MKIVHTFIAALVLSITIIPNANSTIFFDFIGECAADCSRFGLTDGTTFMESNVLGISDATDTSAGAAFTIANIESFNLFGIDFLTGNNITVNGAGVVSSTSVFSTDDVLDGFILAGGSNAFCYDVTGYFCNSGRFDTIVSGSAEATGNAGHGIGRFIRASAVPEPMSLSLLGFGLVALGWSRRNKA